MLFASTTTAQSRYCPIDGEFCMSVAVPQVSAQSGSGNLYFQVEALDTYTWVAIGTGSGMSGSNIFVVYQDGRGNVTVSTRSGTGRTMPRFQADTQIEVLAGSGVSQGVMRANVLCRNCESWRGGSMELTANSAPWIAAWRPGNPLNSPDTSVSLAQHADFDQFRINLSQAAVVQDANPFLTGTTTGSGNTGNTNGNTGNAGDTSGNTNGIGSGTASGGNSGGSSRNNRTVNLVRVHGVLMALAFVVLYPIGAILIPLVGRWYIHAACQSIAFLVMWAGFGTGYATASSRGILFKQTHTILGAVVTFAMVLQPALGLLHHRHYRKYQSRTVVSYVHIWYGRALLLIGVVNGGLGLRMAGSPSAFIIAYAVLAAVLGAAYGASTLVGSMRKSREFQEKQSGNEMYSPNYTGGRGGSGSGYNNNNANYNNNYPRREDVPAQFQFERRDRGDYRGYR